MSETYNGCDTSEYIAVPGPRGPQGQRGAQGNPGPMGPMGPEGPAGVMGPQGCQGPKGDRGPRGEKGDKGEPGTPGERGPQGVEGPRGCNGKDGVVKWSDEITPEQIDLLRGPRGFQGEKGQRGEPGPMGGLGPRGPKGDKGETGETGATGPMGPRGLTGERGPQGLRGYTGPQGLPGDARITDQVSSEGVFSSQKVVDFTLHGNTEWTPNKGHNLSVPHTQNGYVRHFKVLGKTLKNLCNYKTNEKEEPDKVIQVTSLETNPDILFDSKGVIEKFLPNGTYTLMFDTESESNFGQYDKAVIRITEANIDISQHAKFTEEVTIDLRLGANKGIISPETPRKIEKIEIIPYKNTSGHPIEDEEAHPNFTAKNFMILTGDWTNYVCPDFFYGNKSIGKPNKDIATKDDPNKKYYIEIESRNKNLINEETVIHKNYLNAQQSQPHAPGGKLLRWEIDSGEGVGAPTPNSAITFLVNVEPEEDYVLWKLDKKGTLGRLAIAGYKDVPENGEAGVNLAYEEPTLSDTDPIEKHVKFRVPQGINVLALYLGRIERPDQEVNEVLGQLQLERVRYNGNDEPWTSYEKYSTRTKKIWLPNQIRDGEYLYWDDIRRAYCIKKQRETITTINTDEHSIHTYDGMTYVYIASRVPTEISGDFPIKGHDDYYTKDQTYDRKETETKIFELAYPRSAWKYDKTSGLTEGGYFGLPNGIIVEFKMVNLESLKTPGSSQDLRYLDVQLTKIKTVIHAQITGFSSMALSESAGAPSWEQVDAKAVLGVGTNGSGGSYATIRILANKNSSTKKVLLMVMGTNTTQAQ